MKKNAMLKIAAILLIAVLLTTCAISATFAKYTTSSSMTTASARVAKWGVTVSVTADAPFAKAYTGTGSAGDVVVSTVEVVAPGTKNDSAVAFTITGTPEVKTTTTSSFDLTLSNWNVPASSGTGTEQYCPIVFTVTVNSGTPTTIRFGQGGISTLAGLEKAVEDALNDAAGTKAAGTNLSKSVVLGWAWSYTGDDAKDTALGNAATAATISISGGITITQVGSDYALAKPPVTGD